MPAPLVAIVEDDEHVRKALDRLLRAAGLETCTFGSCAAFLESLHARRPGCVVVDLHLPGMSGVELLHEMQARGTRVPTIMVTAHDAPGARARCLAAGATAYLPKPLDDWALIDAIAQASIGKE